MRKPDVHFSPVPHRVIEEMLRIADVTAADMIYDLGCGDGRILIAAAQRIGARGVGIDIDPDLIQVCRASAAAAGLADKTEFLQGNLFEADLSGANVLMLYLLDSLNVQLRPKIFAECRPGTRVVTYSFEMGDWEADAYTPIAANGVLLWVVPANMTGSWRVADAGNSTNLTSIVLQQKYQKLSGHAVIDGETWSIRDGRVAGQNFTLTLSRGNNAEVLSIAGRISGNLIDARVQPVMGDSQPWFAQRDPGTERKLEVVG